MACQKLAVSGEQETWVLDDDALGLGHSMHLRARLENDGEGRLSLDGGKVRHVAREPRRRAGQPHRVARGGQGLLVQNAYECLDGRLVKIEALSKLARIGRDHEAKVVARGVEHVPGLAVAEAQEPVEKSRRVAGRRA